MALILSAAMMACLAGCGSSSSGSDTAVSTSSESAVAQTSASVETSTEPVDKVVISLTASSFDTSPFGAGSVPRFWFVQNMYASFYCNPAYGTSLDDMQPWLAKSITKVDDLTYNVELYDYIHDSKGNLITSEDVVFSYEYAAVLEEKKKLYARYRPAKKVMMDYQIAKQDRDRFLKLDEEEPEKQPEKEQQNTKHR